MRFSSPGQLSSFDFSGGWQSARLDFAPGKFAKLDVAEKELREALDDIPGAQLERKHFSVAAHHRSVNENNAFRVALAVDAVAARHRELRRIKEISRQRTTGVNGSEL